MFDNYPYTIKDGIDCNLVPWSKKIRDDFHVIVYEEGNTLIFAPRYPTSRVFRDCFTDALDTAQQMIKEGKCESYNLSISFSPTIPKTWPHIKLETK